MESEEAKNKIQELESRKKKLITEITKFNERKRYKEYEKRALEPFVEKTKTIRVGPLRKMIKALEFKIATQAFTPKRERDILKELKKLEKEYKQVREVERARRKLSLVNRDIEESDSGIIRIEGELKDIRNTLKDLYKKQKMSKMAKNKGLSFGKSNEFSTLGEVALIEDDSEDE